MKINEVILEDAVGKIPPRLQQSTVGLTKFRDQQFADRVYELNRVMMAVAAADGVNPLQIDIDSESWAGRNNLAFPYTHQEQAMLKQAFKAIGSHYEDLNHGDLESQELKGTNKVSPVSKPKKNKFGV
jgi:dipeptidase